MHKLIWFRIVVNSYCFFLRFPAQFPLQNPIDKQNPTSNFISRNPKPFFQFRIFNQKSSKSISNMRRESSSKRPRTTKSKQTTQRARNQPDSSSSGAEPDLRALAAQDPHFYVPPSTFDSRFFSSQHAFSSYQLFFRDAEMIKPHWFNMEKMIRCALPELLDAQGWIGAVGLHRNYSPAVVRNFYANLEAPKDVRYPAKCVLTSRIFGKNIRVDVAMVCRILGVPNEGLCVFKGRGAITESNTVHLPYPHLIMLILEEHGITIPWCTEFSDTFVVYDESHVTAHLKLELNEEGKLAYAVAKRQGKRFVVARGLDDEAEDEFAVYPEELLSDHEGQDPPQAATEAMDTDAGHADDGDARDGNANAAHDDSSTLRAHMNELALSFNSRFNQLESNFNANNANNNARWDRIEARQDELFQLFKAHFPPPPK